MLTYLVLSWRSRWFIYLLLLVILVVLGVGFAGTQVVTNSMSIQALENLEENWRWQYDILVYPKDAQEYRGLGDGWVAPQTSIASYGGISGEDLDRIRKITGVELAAPLSLIGFFDYDHVLAVYEEAESGKFYETEHVQKVFDGLRDIVLVDYKDYREYVDPNAIGETHEQFIQNNVNFRYENFFRTAGPPARQLRIPNKMLMVAVDPEAEDPIIWFV